MSDVGVCSSKGGETRRNKNTDLSFFIINNIITPDRLPNLAHHDYYTLPMWGETLAEPVLLHCAELLSCWSLFQFCTGSHQSRHKRQNANMVCCLKTEWKNVLQKILGLIKQDFRF